ncbi:MAG: hypothetical protein H7143_07835, partial [Pseudorhodobacter sp.]|nr:hypothetical protein [Rhizobacter sp.]
GPVTAIPLLLFAAGARRISMSTLGLLQYLGPSIQFVLGLWLFKEPFSNTRAVGFGLIWAALVIYTLEAWRFAQGGAAQANAMSATGVEAGESGSSGARIK